MSDIDKVKDLIRKTLHPLIVSVLPLARNFKLTAFSVVPLTNSEPAIYVSNHSNVHDFPVAAEILKKQFYVLADDEPRGKLAGLGFEVNGVVWVNRFNRVSRKKAFGEMLKTLEEGKNLLIYPEGTWNLSDCLPMLPLPWGVIQLAQKTGCPIIPITLEYPDMKNCYYSIGNEMYFSADESKLDAINRLRDTMASMRWEFWASNGIYSRSHVSSLDKDAYVKNRIEEYPVFDYELEQTMIFNAGQTSPRDVYAHLSKIEPRQNTAFLFRNDYIKELVQSK